MSSPALIYGSSEYELLLVLLFWLSSLSRDTHSHFPRYSPPRPYTHLPREAFNEAATGVAFTLVRMMYEVPYPYTNGGQQLGSVSRPITVTTAPIIDSPLPR